MDDEQKQADWECGWDFTENVMKKADEEKKP